MQSFSFSQHSLRSDQKEEVSARWGFDIREEYLRALQKKKDCSGRNGVFENTVGGERGTGRRFKKKNGV